MKNNQGCEKYLEKKVIRKFQGEGKAFYLA
jgi:hypothetical protein